MAEAVVEENPIPLEKWFFCHMCSTQIPRVLEDYTCPTCLGGFIEEVDECAHDESMSSDEEMDDMPHLELLNQVGEFLFGLGSERGPTDSDRNQLRALSGAHFENASPQANRRSRRRLSPWNREGHNPVEHVIQDFIVNLTGVGWGPMGPGGRGNGPVYFLGNAGDYAWGRDGLDAIVTQLLNQMDVAGPPPLDKEKINEIPESVITQDQADKNLQCSVCWEDFEVGELVRKLECEHVYHGPCIVPWLELHGTCPICRKRLSSDQEDKPGSGPSTTGLPELSAILRANGRWSSGSPFTISNSDSSTTSNSSNSTTGSTNSSNSTRRSIPPPDNHMDFEFD